MTATPKYQKPVYLYDISTPSEIMSGVYQCFSQRRRGDVFNEESVQGTLLLVIKTYLPDFETFGFTAHLRSLTCGQFFPQWVFSHWDIINQDSFEVKSKTYEITMNIRKKGKD